MTDPGGPPEAGLTPPAFWTPEYLVDSAWHEHAPFAFWVIDAHRPRALVELGTHSGFSYMAFCQAVERLATGTRCYAVDTWKGDEHAGFYGEEVFEQLQRDHDTRYRSFSELLRTTFAEAARHFDDGSVDLLHIDGAHHLDDVSADLDTWLPKMSERGVILFHDINVHRDDFGVYALWDRIKQDYPHFSFDHGHGLGVLGVGPEAMRTVGTLFAEQDTPRGDQIRRAFARLGEGIRDRRTLTNLEAENRRLGEPFAASGRETERLGESLAASGQETERLRRESADLERQRAALKDTLGDVTKDLEAAGLQLNQQRDQLNQALAARDAYMADAASLQASTSWRVTAPLRAISRGLGRVTRLIRRGLKVVWWTVTLQLPKRLQAYRAYRSAAALTPSTASIASERQRFSTPGPWFEEFAPAAQASAPRAKVIAMYLPQYHTIPENDAWWGKGFTEWTNLGRGTPRFVDHYQPRTPRDLGFYDLSDPTVMSRQIAMAQAAGVHAFCFYYYRFPEGRLLEKPTEAFLADPSLEMPFCLMWANENWTRTWDGYDKEVLRGHDYNQALEDELIADMVRHFADRRYLRIDGRPLFLLYRPHLVPEAAETFARWRRRIEEQTGEVPLLLMAQSFNDFDPTPYGLDGAIEFPPHKYGNFLPEIQRSLEILDPEFSGSVRSYADLVVAARTQPKPPFKLMRTVVPSWDNDARRPGRGLTLTGSTPALFQEWLEDSIDYALADPLGSEPLVFINAWNEWTEGAYLEPDVHFGAAYLNAMSRAVQGLRLGIHRRRVLLVGHDAVPRGAQRLLLELGRVFVHRFGMEVEFLLLADGDLIDDYRSVAPVTVMAAADPRMPGHLEAVAGRGFRHAITNTVVSGRAVPRLRHAGFGVVSLVHEMGSFIEERGWQDDARAIAESSERVVFPATMVAERFSQVAPVDASRTVINPQGLYLRPTSSETGGDSRTEVRRELGLPPETAIVIGVGHADLRKGFDLFSQTAAVAASSGERMAFVWVGGGEWQLLHWLVGSQPDTTGRVITVGHTEDVSRYYAAADALFVSSREDAFPSTVLEALAHGLPVVAFAGCTGTEELIERTGRVVTAFDLNEAAAALAALTRDRDIVRAKARRTIVERDYAFTDYAFRLAQVAFTDLRRISVAIPTYNYAHHLEQRLTSVFNQTHPVFEVTVLDDASTDDTPAILEAVRRASGREFTVVRRDQNVGSIWRQWRTAASQATSEYLWIAEADDDARPALLDRLAEALGREDSTALAFSDSSQVDGHGRPLGDSYRTYLDAHAGTRFTTDFRMNGVEFRERHLRVRNLILNTSGVLFRREPLLEVLERNIDDLLQLRFAGDWLVYAELCSVGDIAFVNQPLNVHRRHSGATLGTNPDAHVAEIARVHEMLNQRFGATPELLAEQQAYLREALDSLTQTK